MSRLPIDELNRRCQKPDHQQVGNWMARRVSRPAALRLTRVIAPWGATANLTTLAAWGVGLAAAAALAWGSIGGWLAGAVLLQLWYLLDHVDGQLARLRGTASLDGVQLDYLMHHTLNLTVPLGIGCGLFAATLEPPWALLGLGGGMGLLLITLHHDARYKAMIQRLKRVHGRLQAIGGGGARPTAQPPLPRHPVRLAAWTARKMCEAHVVMNAVTLVAVAQWLAGDTALLLGRVYLAALAPAALAVAAWTLVRSQHRHEAETEFAACFHPAPGDDLRFLDGWWMVDRREGEPS